MLQKRVLQHLLLVFPKIGHEIIPKIGHENVIDSLRKVAIQRLEDGCSTMKMKKGDKNSEKSTRNA